MVRNLGLLPLVAVASLGFVLAGCGDDDTGTECGNGVLEGSESCDGSDLGTATCADLGFTGGQLGCTATCEYDTTACTNTTQDCGNGTQEGTEQCDGLDLGGATCESLGHTGGTLACASDCTYDETSCTDQGGCGNGTVEGTEECDGLDLGGATCESLGHTGGTLACDTATCTYDESGCVDTCGDGVLDPTYEVCDGADFGGETCATQGNYDGGTLACSSDCQTIDTSGCCTDACAAEGVTCNGDTLETCTRGASGCLELTTEDCTANGNVCSDAGGTAACVPACTNDCTTVGETQCVGDTLRTCSQVGACTLWVDTDCTSAILPSGHCGGSPAQCLGDGDGTACDNVYDLSGRSFPHTISGEFNGGAIANPGSCQTYGANPLYMSYTIQGTDVRRLQITVEQGGPVSTWPILSAWTSTEPNRTFCNAANITEIGCAEASSRSVTLTLDPTAAGLGAGDTVYLLASGDGTFYPLQDPVITVTEEDCAAVVSTATLTSPPGTTDQDPRLPIVITFSGDAPVQNTGTIEIQENGTQVALYDLSAAPAEVTWVDSHTLHIVPATPLSTGVTVSVILNLSTSLCSQTIADTLTWTTVATLPPTGEDCTDVIPANDTGHTAPPAFLGGASLDVLTPSLTDCAGFYNGTADSVWSFTMQPGMTDVEITITKSAYNGLVAVLLDACGTAVVNLGCVWEFDPAEMTLSAEGLTPGHTYYLVLGNTRSSDDWPDPGFAGFDIRQTRCGDGAIQASHGETCDDGNTTAGDGCSDACQVEANYVCWGEPSACAVPVTPTHPGDLVITEIMQDPDAVADSAGEWFEIYNPTSTPFDLNGLVISDGGSDSFTVLQYRVIRPGQYFVFGNNWSTNTNGGVSVDHPYTGFTLGNGADEIILTMGSVEIDRVEYDGGPNFPDPTGQSMQLDPGAMTATANDSGANWCATTIRFYGDGDRGSPGAPNHACSAPILFSEEFETDPTARGWTLNADWEWGTPSNVGPSACKSGSCIGTNLAGNYSSGLAWDVCTATSPAIDLSGTTNPTLSFFGWVSTEGGRYDGVNLKVSTDGVNFTVVTAVNPAYNLSDVAGEPAWGGVLSSFLAKWSRFEADLSAYAGQTIYLQFGCRSDSSSTYPGWYVDDILLYDN